ncbi:MAG: FliI/YscN family ATPase [Mariprofundaceae bacterium]
MTRKLRNPMQTLRMQGRPMTRSANGSPLWDKHARQSLLAQQQHIRPFPLRGKVHKLVGPVLEASGLTASIGHACEIVVTHGRNIEAEVVGFRDEHTLLMPVGSTIGIAPGAPIIPLSSMPGMRLGPHLLGRVLDALGQPMDGRALSPSGSFMDFHGEHLNPCARQMIDTPMQLGIRAIDACLPMGWGQRMGLFAGAGVGKSSLMGMLARNSDAEINVIALIGERNREVREFIEVSLGKEALAHSIVIVATSDMPPVARVRAAAMATTVAEYFRAQGKQVLLMMDSLTRVAQAQREIGLMLGEPPTSKGYTPSCLSLLAKLLERSGPGVDGGNISALYTVLVEGDDLQADPIADAAMAVLDGHVVLDRQLAEQGHFPAINILRSVSRLATSLFTPEQAIAVRNFRRMMSLYERMEDMISIGAYESGSNPELDRVIDNLPEIRRFLQQETHSQTSRLESAQRLLEVVRKLTDEEGFHETQNITNTGPTQ